jgi:hypothetical protein
MALKSKDDGRAIRAKLTAIYGEMMWLAARKNVSPSMARAWYTHVWADRLSRAIRHFSGKVSYEAMSDTKAVLRLEHHSRIQTTLTQLIAAHLKRKRPSAKEFIRIVLKCENVHIVTFKENYAARKSGGSYQRAGIKLVAWRSIPEKRRRVLWTKMLRHKVANASAFASKA